MAKYCSVVFSDGSREIIPQSDHATLRTDANANAFVEVNGTTYSSALIVRIEDYEVTGDVEEFMLSLDRSVRKKVKRRSEEYWKNEGREMALDHLRALAEKISSV